MMRVSYLRRFGLAAGLILALGLPAAFGQSEPAKSAERPWTDPPARSAPLGPSSDAAPPKPASAAAIAPPRVRRMARAQAPAVSRRPLVAETRNRRRIAERPAATRTMHRRATVEVRPVYRSFGIDERSRRIRAAEEAGFLVVRSRTIEFPDGRRMRSYSPYEPEDFDD